MVLWLALLLPALPLQLAQRALPPALQATLPLAIVDGPPQRLQVIHCNAAARASGIAPGMKLAAAQALERRLATQARDTEREARALHELACWATQFSSQVVLQPDGVLLEIGGSLRLYGGHAALRSALAAGLAQLGYEGVLAEAEWPRTARAQALARLLGATARTLHAMPLAVLEWDDATVQMLHALGLTTLGDVLQLPRDALARRFGAERLHDLDRLCGCRSDPQPLFEPPARFAARLELPADLSDTAHLMLPAQRLLAALEGWLRGRNAGAAQLDFVLGYSPYRSETPPPTTVTLALAAPERDARRLAALLAERLARVTLPAPAITLALNVGHTQPFAAINASLLPQPTSSKTSNVDWLQLAETLHARLGSERVFQLQAVDDHRPEHAWRAVPLALDSSRSSERAALCAVAAAPRPLLLLPAPQPLAGDAASHGETPTYASEPLALVTGPERIEVGWWDHAGPAAGSPARAVHRDYFVARSRRGQLLWVYRELAAPRGWFLHGLFA